MTPLRVVVADDAVLIREGVERILTAGGCDVVGAVRDAGELARLLDADHGVDAVVLDIRMPPTHTDEGVEAVERLRASGSTVGVLLLSMYASPALAMRALACGPGTGYLLKERVADRSTLVEAVRTVAGGGSVVDQELVRLLVDAARTRDPLDALTAREREVLALMAEGRSNTGIASRLHLSVKTVETHIAHLLDKLGIEPSPEEHRRVLAVLRLLRPGL